jgi:hypothetical protein
MQKKDLIDMFPKLFKVYTGYLSIKRRFKSIYYSSLDERKYPGALAKVYKKRMGESLNWNDLKTYNEKLQWAKLYDNTPLKTTLTDKYLVRRWIEKTIGEEYLIPILGVWDHFDEINFDKLPDKFVLKTNNGSGTNLIVKDKSRMNLKEAKKKFDKWLRMDFAFMGGFELHYKDIEPKIIAEELIQDSDGDLKDYKFICFDGDVHYCWIDSDRFTDHRRNVYNLEWELQEWTQHKYKNIDTPVPKPENFELMVDLSKRLCQGFSHVRVDLYNVDGKIYFGEMTFTNGSGFEKIHPHKYNLMLGDLWKLPIDSYTVD